MQSMKPLPSTRILREALSASGVSPEHLAVALGRPLSLVSRWLDGREEIDVLTLAEALHILEQPPEQVGRAICALLDVAA